MEWRDEGALIAFRTHGESAAIIEVLTRDHGRHAGVVRGGASRRLAPLLQPGAQLDVTWRGRLEEHIGTFSVEPLRSRAGLMGERGGYDKTLARAEELAADFNDEGLKSWFKDERAKVEWK